MLLITGCSNDSDSVIRTSVDNLQNDNSPVYRAQIDSSLYFKGLKIFKADCNQCHVTKDRLHNYLEGVYDRVGESYLKLFLTKQDSLVLAKDSNALMLKDIWGHKENSHNFPYSERELNALIEYIK